MEVAHGLVRRAIEVHADLKNETSDEQNPMKEVAFIGLVLVGFTFVLYMAVVSAIDYTYGNVVATLAMIESPTTKAYVLEQDETDTKEPLLAEEDVLLVRAQPITAKLRTAVRHIQAIAGPFARFRGLGIALLYNFLNSLALAMVKPIVPSFLRPVVAVLTSIALCRIHLVWTHAVISMPSSKSIFKRLPSMQMAKKLVLPTAIWALAIQASLYIPATLISGSQELMKHPEAYGGKLESEKLAVVQIIGAGLIFLTTILLVVVPAEVSLKRVEASMLPEEENTIVPFDKSFSGKFKPLSLGGTGAVSMLDAWKTFGKEGRVRLVKLYLKVFAMQVATIILFTLIIIGELKMIMGRDFQRMIDSARKSIKGEL